MIRWLCAVSLALYPRAWQARYGAELRALLDARGPSFSALVDLLRGALDAHVRPAGIAASPRQQMRGTLWATVVCFGALAMIGAGFAKATEDATFRIAAAAHPLLGYARGAVLALAVACVGVIGLGGGPIAFAVFRQAWRERTPALVRALRSAAIVTAVVIVATGLVTLAARGRRGPSPVGDVVLVSFAVLLAVVTVVCARAVRASVMTTRFSPVQLVLGVGAAWLLARLMVALTAAVGLYAVAAVVDAPALAASANGPFDLATKLVLGLQLAGMTAASALAVVTTRRGCAALLGR